VFGSGNTSKSSLTLVCLQARGAGCVSSVPGLANVQDALDWEVQPGKTISTRGLSLLSLQLSLDAFVDSGRNREANPTLPIARARRHAAG
jgi:hypothetical protein